MPRMTNKQARDELQAAYDALDSFDSASLQSLQCDMITARHHLRTLKHRYFDVLRDRAEKRPSRASVTPMTGLEQGLFDE